MALTFRFVPVDHPAAGPHASNLVLYREEDVKIEGGFCGYDDLTEPLEPQEESFEAYDPTVGFATVGVVTVATDADFEYYVKYGSNTNSQIEGIINQASFPYQLEIGFSLSVGPQHVYEILPQPYTSTAASALLGEFRHEWNLNHASESRDVAHLFTGKELDGSVIGMAYRGKVWKSPSMAYALSQDHSSVYKIVAHEIGHNFNAIHICDKTSETECRECEGNGPIMCPSLQNQGTLLFSGASVCRILHFTDYYAP
jgi:hypothetical protein